jgi:hypothetical protein
MMTEFSQPGSGTTYRFEFFRTMVNDRGDCYRCLIDTVEIENAPSLDDALSAALRAFERKHQLSAWNHLAHGYETHEISGKGCDRAP